MLPSPGPLRSSILKDSTIAAPVHISNPIVYAQNGSIPLRIFFSPAYWTVAPASKLSVSKLFFSREASPNSMVSSRSNEDLWRRLVDLLDDRPQKFPTRRVSLYRRFVAARISYSIYHTGALHRCRAGQMTPCAMAPDPCRAGTCGAVRSGGQLSNSPICCSYRFSAGVVVCARLPAA